MGTLISMVLSTGFVQPAGSVQLCENATVQQEVKIKIVRNDLKVEKNNFSIFSKVMQIVHFSLENKQNKCTFAVS